MRVLLLTDGWTDNGHRMDPATVAHTASEAWRTRNVSDDVVTLAVGDGGPASGRLWSGESPQDTTDYVVRDNVIVLTPPPGSEAWDPALLGNTLTHVAQSPEFSGRTIVVPLGDTHPQHDATLVWGNSTVSEMRQALSGLTVQALVSSSRPLLGLKGMSASLRDGRENDVALATHSQAQEAHWNTIARHVDEAQPRSLMGPSRLSDVPGTGAAGGLAYCLAAVGAQLLPASARLAELAGAGAVEPELVVAITPELTPHLLDHGVARAASDLAAATGAPCAVLTPEVLVGKRDLMAGGIAAAHEGTATAADLASHVARVCQTWSPRR
ncbi:glycerate kinase [Demequina sp. B12]|uniref:glycerate kinase n=1 Tax=Demequina sp. B12 TaxID=2992757 RepID=UPI00237ABDB7|nr:glycerate kinase [Demequina sp. B12]MDE0572950.1 glycerate kinase [Demequina sp. B12]